MVFVLAYDRRIVEAALRTDEVTGSEYLAKIAQLEHSLPRIEGGLLREITRGRIGKLFTELEGEVDAVGVKMSPEDLTMLAELLSPHFRTLRGLGRYTQSVSFYYPSVRGEIDLIDFMCVMALKTLYGNLYDWLSLFRRELISKPDSSSPNNIREKVRESLESLDVSGSQSRDVMNLVSFLYPTVALNGLIEEFDEYGHSIQFFPFGGKRDRLARDERFFDRYYTFSVPSSEVSEAQISVFLKSDMPTEHLAALLPDIRDYGRIDGFIERYTTRAAETDDYGISHCLALFDYFHRREMIPNYEQLGQHRVFESEQGGDGSYGPRVALVDKFCFNVVPKFFRDGGELVASLERLMDSVQPLSVVIRILDLVTIFRNWGSRWESQELLSVASARLRSRVVNASEDGTLWTEASLSYILDYWLGGPHPVSPEVVVEPVEAIRNHVLDSADFVDFWERCRFPHLVQYAVWTSQVEGMRIQTRFSPLIVGRVFEGHLKVLDRLREIHAGDDAELGERAARLIEAFEESEFPEITG